jgi:hypothetical protein
MTYRLYESAAYLGVHPAFADSDDFDALRLWAVDHNYWKGIRTVAVIVSDEERFWKVRRDGSVQEVSDVRGRTGGPSQVERYATRLHGRATPESAAQLGYEVPGPDRWQHQTIHVSMKGVI